MTNDENRTTFRELKDALSKVTLDEFGMFKIKGVELYPGGFEPAAIQVYEARRSLVVLRGNTPLVGINLYSNAVELYELFPRYNFKTRMVWEGVLDTPVDEPDWKEFLTPGEARFIIAILNMVSRLGGETNDKC